MCPQLSDTPPGALTRSASKVKHYSDDLYFREGWADAIRLWGDTAVEEIKRLALIILMPEAVASRSVVPVVDMLAAEDLQPHAIELVQFDRRAVRELWRYQLSNASLDRLRYLDYRQTLSESLILLLRDGRSEIELPAAVRVSNEKGPAAPEKRLPHHVRSKLPLQNRLLTFFHCSNEPADVIRELAVLYPKSVRVRLLAGDPAPRAHLDELLADVYPKTPIHDLDAVRSVARIRACIQARGALGKDVHRLINLMDDVATGRGDWFELVERLEKANVAVDPWDVLILGSAVINVEESPRLISSTALTEWEA